MELVPKTLTIVLQFAAAPALATDWKMNPKGSHLARNPVHIEDTGEVNSLSDHYRETDRGRDHRPDDLCLNSADFQYSGLGLRAAGGHQRRQFVFGAPDMLGK